MQVHCPECNHEFVCQVGAAGEVLACPSCFAQFKISAKETVFYLDSMDGTGTAVLGQQGTDRLDIDSLGPGDRLDGYVIERELGRGGMGIVFLATQLSLGKMVAIKVLPPDLAQDREFLQRFHRETRALAEMSHPHIISVIDKGCYKSIFYFVMEYVEGVTLRQLTEEKKLSPDQALQLVPQICSALDYAHSKGIVHRDIKPENIIIDHHGNANIADFGLSKIIGEKEMTRITQTNTVMGTYDYMAPEQKLGSAGVDHRADLYSLGVVLYEMLTGEIPAGNFEPPSKRNNSFGDDLDKIIMRVLERDPDRRYQNASELATDVKKARELRGGLVVKLPEGFDTKQVKKAGTRVLAFIKANAWWFWVALILAFWFPSMLFIWCFIGAISLFGKFFGDDDDRKYDYDTETGEIIDREKRAEEEAAALAAAEAAREEELVELQPAEFPKKVARRFARAEAKLERAKQKVAAKMAKAQVKLEAAQAKADAEIARAQAKAGKDLQVEIDKNGIKVAMIASVPKGADEAAEVVDAEEDESAPRGVSGMAVASFVIGLPLLLGAVALFLLGGTIRGAMLYLSTAAMAGVLVGIAGGGLPGVLSLVFARSGLHRCKTRNLRGRSLAMWGLLFSLTYIGSVGYLWYNSFDDLVSWRALEDLASQQDPKTLDALEAEIKRPELQESRDRAARVLVSNAPRQAFALSEESSDRRVILALVHGFRHSPEARLANKVALKAMTLDMSRDNAHEVYEVFRRNKPVEVLPVLTEQIDKHHVHRGEAIRTVLVYRVPGAVDALGSIGSDESIHYRTRIDAAERLEIISTPPAARALIRMLSSNSPYVRRAADTSLRRMTGEKHGTGFSHQHPNSNAINEWHRRVDGWEARLKASNN